MNVAGVVAEGGSVVGDTTPSKAKVWMDARGSRESVLP